MYDDLAENFYNWQCNTCLLKQMPFYQDSEIEVNNIGTHGNNSIPDYSCADTSSDLRYSDLQGSGLKIAHLNVNSIYKHIDEVKVFVKSNNIHLLALNETKLDDSIYDKEISIEDYVLVRKDRNRHGGGVAIYVNKALHFDELRHETMDDLEVIAIKVYLKHKKPLVFSTWYRPPSSNVDIFDLYENFLNYIDGLSGDTILVGDTNCDLLSRPLASASKKYSELNSMYSLMQINDTEPTRITNTSSTLVDHLLTNNPNNVKKHGVIHNGMSDHSVSYLIWNSNVSASPKVINFRNMKNLNSDEFRSDVKNQPWDKLCECNSIDDAVELWQNLFLDVINKHMPMRRKRVKDNSTPWMNSEIFKLMKKRDKLKKKAHKLRDDKLMSEYRKLRNKVTAEIGKAKKKYYTKLFSHSSKQTWKTLKSVIPDQKSKESVTVTSGDNAEVANRFNNFFAEVGSKLADKVPHVPASDENATSNDSFEFTHINNTDVLDIIHKLKNTKSVGLDDISVLALKMCALEITPSITYLINLSLQSGTFPKQWKRAKVIPIHKSGDKESPSNYRPISILPCVSKILERVVQRQIISYLHKNDILSSAQSGFRPLHSTITTLLKVTDDWLHAMDRKEYTGAVFIDLKKAFDTVDSDVLIKKLNMIGINGTSCLWFKNYMSDRICRTLVNNELSSESKVTCGVPQGSLLGPLLFIIYINDLVDCVKICKIQLYADDTVLYFSHTSVQNIQSALNSDLQNVYRWICQNKLSVNCEKTVCMLFGDKHLLSKNNVLTVSLHNNPLNQVRKFKYLGLLCDENLHWNLHIESMLNRIGKMVGFLGRLRRSLSESVLKLVYKSIILPYFDYGDIIYSATYKKYTDKLQKLQNRAGRIILRIKPESHVSVAEMHNSLSWQHLEDRWRNHSLVIMYKIMNNLTPDYLRNEFELVNHSYISRFGPRLHLPKPRTENLKRSFKYRCAKAYNELSADIKSATSVNLFKSKLYMSK